MRPDSFQRHSRHFRKHTVRTFSLLAGLWILGGFEVVRAQQVWVRKGPVFYSNGRNEKPRDAVATDDSFTSTDVNGKTNRITWSIPPATLVEGQDVVLTMESTTNEGAPLVGGWRVRDAGERAATVLDTDVGSFAGFKARGVFNQARLVFKFKPGLTPTFSLKAGRYDAYGGHMSTLVTWTYEKGTAETAGSSDVIQLWEPKTTYSWCRNASSFVWVKGAPANVSPEAGMVLVEGQNGKVLETYPSSGEWEFEGGTTLWVPDDDGWEVVVKVPGTAILHLEPSTTLTLPCRSPSDSERRSAEIEVSGGVLHWIWNGITGQQHPDFVIIRTKDAIGGSKERPGNTGRNKRVETPDESRSAHHAVNQQNNPGLADRDFTVDQRDSRGTKFIVYKGELEITPTNNQLRPFTLRAGQQVQVSRSSISAITPVTGTTGGVDLAAGATGNNNSSGTVSSAALLTVEYDTDRPGEDYKSFDLPSPNHELCREACAKDSQCQAYTYVKPGVQGPDARCWLKSSRPAGNATTCCISGVREIGGVLGAVLSGIQKDRAITTDALNPNDPDLVPLKLYWSAQRGDNYSTATDRGEGAAQAASYQFAGVQGYVFRTQKPGTVPLKNYWSAQRGDNFTTATAEGEAAALAAGYTYAGVEGYIYSTQQPGTVALKTFWSVDRGDNFSTATAIGEQNAKNASYRLAYIEGYILPSR